MLPGDHKNAPSELPRIVGPDRAERGRYEQFPPLNQAESPQENKRPAGGGFTRQAASDGRLESSPHLSAHDSSEGAGRRILGQSRRRFARTQPCDLGRDKGGERNNDLDWDGDVEMQVAAKNLHAPGHPGPYYDPGPFLVAPPPLLIFRALVSSSCWK